MITGAAAIMAAVFVSFAAAPIATVSQMGVGLTVAILLDATVVRIVLLPALMLMLGDRVWRTPAWLDRLLPELEHAASERNLRTFTYRRARLSRYSSWTTSDMRVNREVEGNRWVELEGAPCGPYSRQRLQRASSAAVAHARSRSPSTATTEES